MRRLVRTLLTVLILVVPFEALARPYPGISGLAATADSAATAGNNPAGMARFDQSALQAEFMTFYSESTWEGQIGDELTYDSDNSSTIFVPLAYYLRPVGERLHFGFTLLGVGFSDDLGDWPGRYFIQTYESITVSAFPSLSFKVTDKFSIAGSLQLSYASFEQERVVANILDPTFGDGLSTIETDGFDIGWGASTLYQFSDRTRWGLAYLSELNPELDGDNKFSNLGPNTEQLLGAAGLLNADITVHSVSPQRVVTGIYHEFENRHAFTVDLAWMDFSNFQLSEFYINGDQLTQNEEVYEDIYAVSASYSFPLSPRWMLGISAIYTSDMIKDEHRTMTFRMESIRALGIGAEWQWRDDRLVEFSLSYMDLGEAPVEAPDIAGVGSASGHYSDRALWQFVVGISFGAL